MRAFVGKMLEKCVIDVQLFDWNFIDLFDRKEKKMIENHYIVYLMNFFDSTFLSFRVTFKVFGRIATSSESILLFDPFVTQ